MANRDDGDRSTFFPDVVDDDVVSDDQFPEGRTCSSREFPAQVRVIFQGLHTIKEILDNAPRGLGVVLGDEVEEFRHPIQSGIGPDDAVRHPW